VSYVADTFMQPYCERFVEGYSAVGIGILIVG